MIIYGDYTYVWDSVQFGIDVREARLTFGWTQFELNAKLGYKSGNLITRVECAQHDDSIKLSDYMALCNILDLRPNYYFDTQRA